MRKIILILIVFLAGCAMTPERQNYIDTIAQEPFVFEVPNRKTDQAWNRAINWITTYSSTSIQVITEDKIRTYQPPENSATVGYVVMKVEKKRSHEFRVNCYGGGQAFDKVTTNCRSLVHYIRWGVAPPDGVIKP